MRRRSPLGKRSLGAVLLVLAMPALANGSVRAGKPHIELEETRRDADRILVSFRVTDGVTDGILERIHSGVPVTFVHKVELLARRSVPLWFPRIISRARIETTVLYDSLTRQYDLQRTTAIRGGGDPATEPELRSHRTESSDEMLAWMTEFAEVPPLAVAEPFRKSTLRVRVETQLGRRYVWFLFPARRTVAAERKLES